jgi:hypothetical protein
MHVSESLPFYNFFRSFRRKRESSVFAKDWVPPEFIPDLIVDGDEPNDS